MARRRGHPPRKPTALLKLRGSYNVTRDGQRRAHEPQAVTGDLREPPPDLTTEQEAIWNYAIEHAPPGLLKQIDRELLKGWCEACDRHNTARLMQAMLDRDSKLKLLIKVDGGLVPSPYNDIMDKCMKTMIRLAQEFGFSPAARPAIHADKPPTTIEGEPVNPWHALRVIDGGKANPPTDRLRGQDGQEW